MHYHGFTVTGPPSDWLATYEDIPPRPQVLQLVAEQVQTYSLLGIDADGTILTVTSGTLEEVEDTLAEALDFAGSCGLTCNRSVSTVTILSDGSSFVITSGGEL